MIGSHEKLHGIEVNPRALLFFAWVVPLKEQICQ